MNIAVWVPAELVVSSGSVGLRVVYGLRIFIMNALDNIFAYREIAHRGGQRTYAQRWKKNSRSRLNILGNLPNTGTSLKHSEKTTTYVQESGIKRKAKIVLFLPNQMLMGMQGRCFCHRVRRKILTRQKRRWFRFYPLMVAIICEQGSEIMPRL